MCARRGRSDRSGGCLRRSLAFADPFFAPLGEYPSIHGIKNVLTLAVVAWNAYAMEQPSWGRAGAIAGAREKVRTPPDPPEIAKIFDDMLDLRADEYASDLRLVASWELESDGTGGFSLHCEGKAED